MENVIILIKSVFNKIYGMQNKNIKIIIRFANTEIEKRKFHYSKYPI